MNWSNLRNNQCPKDEQNLTKTSKGFICSDCGFFVSEDRMEYLMNKIEEKDEEQTDSEIW